MISSTSLDLPEHRQQAIDACWRQGIFPRAMEHLPARDADAIRVSMEMVDEADIYIGIYAWRYGHVPVGHDISITEMEFNRAVERGIPILVFTIHNDHPLTITMVEADRDAQDKLKKLKERACHGRGRLEFKSPVELRSHIIQSLSALLKEQEAATQEKWVPSLHSPNFIPTAPEPYIAHPYSLLQTREVVGRRSALHLLIDWVTGNQYVRRDVRLFTIVAIGGMGKSALTWKWFNDIAPNALPHLARRMWWSFYESNAYFENFVIRALAYTAGLPEAEVRQMLAPEREDRLWQVLDQRPFLLVLDGLERILLAYARMDAAHLPDDGLDEQTTNDIARFYGLLGNIKETYLEKHRLRNCTDSRAGYFLRRQAQVFASRLLISTRLYPAVLGSGDLTTATERLHHVLTRARAVNVVEEELPALTALAELHRRQQHYDTAREFLDQLWTPVKRGPHPLFHADALNVLAQIEHDQGHYEAAVAAAPEAYRHAWCDGPPYAYHFGLTNARRHLQELGASEPSLPPFDASKYEPMPEVELDPEDECHVGNEVAGLASIGYAKENSPPHGLRRRQ